jgi:hypothetical protein
MPGQVAAWLVRRNLDGKKKQNVTKDVVVILKMKK